MAAALRGLIAIALTLASIAIALEAAAQAGPRIYPVWVGASSEFAPHVANSGADQDPNTIWSAGAFPMQWIMLDLGSDRVVGGLRLLTGQWPNGAATHHVYGQPLGAGWTVHFGTHSAYTTDYQWLDIGGSATPVRYVLVQTVASPSWVSWREVEVYGAGGSGGGGSADNAAFVSQSVPTTMVAGGLYPVSVTMQNTGSSTWGAMNGYTLGSIPNDNMVWNLNRVALPASSVPSGGTATFNFYARAPSTAGTHTFQWQMLKEGVSWFGALSTPVSVTVQVLERAPYGNLDYVNADTASGWACDDDLPATPITVAIRAKKDAAEADVNDIHLGWQLATYWRPDVGAAGLCSGGQTHGFDFPIPNVRPDGVYLKDGRVKHIIVYPVNNNDLSSFEAQFNRPRLPSQAVAVQFPDTRPDAAQLLSASPPPNMLSGNANWIPILFRNAGTNTWYPHSHRLAIGTAVEDWSGVFGDGPNTIELPGAVAPGAVVTLYAPVEPIPGTYTKKWRLVRDGVPFGPAVPATTYVVNHNVVFVGQSVVSNLRWSETATVTLTFRNDSAILIPQGTSVNLAPLGYGWGRTQVAIPVNIYPGTTAPIQFAISAPACPPGTNCQSYSQPFSFQWRMRNAFGYFGPPSTMTSITVGPGEILGAPPGPPPDFAPQITIPPFAPF